MKMSRCGWTALALHLALATCFADDAALTENVRIGYLWPNGTVIVPVELTDGYPSSYTGDWQAFEEKQELLDGYLPSKRPMRSSSEFELYETFEPAVEIVQRFRYRVGANVRVFYQDRSDVYSIHAYCRVAAGCGDDLIGYKIETPYASDSRTGPEAVLLGFGGAPGMDVAPVVDCDPEPSLRAMVAEADGFRSEQWQCTPSADSTFTFHYRARFRDEGRDTLMAATRTVFVTAEDETRVHHIYTRDLSDHPGVARLMSFVRVREWFPSYLGHVRAVLRYGGRTYFLLQARGYESAGACLVRFDGSREVRVLYDGRFEGC